VVNNDSLFFACLKGIQEEFKMKEVTTDEILKYMENILGSSVEMCFDNYLTDAKIPFLEVQYKKRLKGYQVIFERTMENYTSLPIAYKFENSDWTVLKFKMSIHINYGDFCATEWYPIILKLTKKQFKSLRFNNDLYLYDVKISKKAKN